MTLEKFNLHITTPEGDEKDPELIRLRAELMAIKPLLDDAIQRESVSEAEELHKQALEAKKRLDDYKEELKRQREPKTIEIAGKKVELGPDLGEMSYNDIINKLDEFNSNLNKEEKPWRIPTRKEFIEIGLPIVEKVSNKNIIKISNKNIIKKHKDEIKNYLEKIDFDKNKFYWSETPKNDDSDQAWYFLAGTGVVSFAPKETDSITVKCIR